MIQRYVFMCGALAICVAAGPQHVRADSDNPYRVVASIDGEPITARDIEKSFLPQTIKGKKLTYRERVEQYVMEELLKREAKERGISVSSADVDRYIAEVQHQNNTNPADFAQMVKDQGLSMELYRKQVEQEIIKARLVGSRMRSASGVSEDEITNYIKSNGLSDGKAGSGRDHIYQQFFPAGEGSNRAAIRKTAEQLREQLVDASPAKWVSLGGEHFIDLGEVAADDLAPELASALEAVGNGETTEVIDTPRGFYMLKIVAAKESRNSDNPALRSEVRQTLGESKASAEIGHYITDELQKKYSVEYKVQ